MKIYDEGILMSHLELEIAKSERFGYPFSLVAIRTMDKRNNTMALLNAILKANFRKTDLIAKNNEGVIILLLNGTTNDDAHIYLNRLITKAVSGAEIPIIAGITSYELGDTTKLILERLAKKIMEN